jgi:uncharacterized membrane protein
MPLVLNTYPHREQGRFCFYSQPNCSLTQRERKNAFWMIAAMTLLIASVFSWLGCWLVLPFAGLEVGVLAWAFDALGKRVGDYESLRICGDEILLERKQGGSLERCTFNCQWVQVVLVEAGPGKRVGLALRSHGRETELGAFLTDEARLELAGELQARIRSGR